MFNLWVLTLSMLGFLGNSLEFMKLLDFYQRVEVEFICYIRSTLQKVYFTKGLHLQKVYFTNDLTLQKIYSTKGLLTKGLHLQKVCSSKKLIANRCNAASYLSIYQIIGFY